MKSVAAEIRIIRTEIEVAANAMISAAMHGLDLIGYANKGDPRALTGLEDTLCEIIQTCAFQDLTGQRLDRLRFKLCPVASNDDRDPLLNGPADPGQGLDQAAADSLFEGGPDGHPK